MKLPRSRRLHTVALLAAAFLALAAPSVEAAVAAPRTAPIPALEFLHAGPSGGPAGVRQLIDGHGRQVLLRGVNVDGLVDYYRTDLRSSYPIDPSSYAHGTCPPDDQAVEGVVLCQRDFAQLRLFGYDAIRLNLSWSLLEPSPGHIERRYVDRVAQVVGWAKAAGIYVILDMHQDAWSKYLYSTGADHCTAPYRTIGGYDGAPQWASIHAQPVCARNGTRELDPAVEEDFAKFFNNAPAPDGVGLRDHFSAAVAALAQRFRDEPTVVGYDLLNEPSIIGMGGTDASVLLPFYAKVIDRVVHRVHGFQQLFFIEPDVTRDISDQSNITVPWSRYSGYRNVAYAPHVYTRAFTPTSFPMDGGYRSALADATHLGLPLWVGEFGSNPKDDTTVLTAHYTEQDAFGLGGALWLWKENSSGSTFWGVYGPPFGPGTPQPERVLLTARAYPLYTAGNLRSLSYDPAAGRFMIEGSSARVPFGDPSRATAIFIPARLHGTVRAAGARLIVLGTAGGRLAYAFPTGGAYSVSVR